MMNMTVLMRASVLLCLAMLLSACGVFKSTKKENVTPPTELTEFAAKVQVERVFSRNLGAGEGKSWARIQPGSDGMRLYVASVAGQVTALELPSGQVAWQSKLDIMPSAGVGVGEATLVVGSSDGEVVALNPDDGTERWRAQVSSEVAATPVIEQGTVVVRSNDGRLFAFNSSDGNRSWVHESTVPKLSLRGAGTPLVTQGGVFVGLDDGKIIAIDLLSGKQVWQAPVANATGRFELDRMVDFDGAMVSSDGLIYAAGYNGRAVALAMPNGAPAWNRELSTYGGVALDDDRLYVSGSDGTVWALDRTTGSALWQQDKLAWRWLSTPAAHGGYAVVADLEGYVHWLDRESGALAARAQASSDAIRAQPLVVNDLVVVVDIDGQLSAYRLAQ